MVSENDRETGRMLSGKHCSPLYKQNTTYYKMHQVTLFGVHFDRQKGQKSESKDKFSDFLRLKELITEMLGILCRDDPPTIPISVYKMILDNLRTPNLDVVSVYSFDQ